MEIKNAIQAMVAMRAGKMDQTSMRLYTARLSKENPSDVLAVLQHVAEAKRGEYESAVPDIGTILSLVEAEKVARQNRTALKKSERLVRWQCPDCKNEMTGYPATNDDLDRRCKSPYKKLAESKGRPLDRGLPAGQICGGKMIVIFDESAEADSGPMTKWEQPEWMTR